MQLLGELFERQVAAAEATRAEPDVQEAGALCQSDMGTESALRPVAGKLQQEDGHRDLRKCVGGPAAAGTKRGGLAGIAPHCKSGAVATYPSANGELAAELGERVMASQSFLLLAELEETFWGK